MESFDFIVVGGGPGGCVVASRLSEDPSASVALLEAGPDRRGLLATHTALGVVALGVRKGESNWGFHTEPDPGLGGRRDYHPDGRGLGGGTAINTLMSMRGHRLDYDGWAAVPAPAVRDRGHAHPARGAPRGRGGGAAGRRAPHPARAARGGPERRRIVVGEAAATVRHRRSGGLPGLRHRPGARAARGRQAPGGSHRRRARLPHPGRSAPAGRLAGGRSRGHAWRAALGARAPGGFSRPISRS